MRILVLLAFLLAACSGASGPTASPTGSAGETGEPQQSGPAAGLGARRQAIKFFNEFGFGNGRESTLADGRQRWVMRATRSDRVELIGSADAVDAIVVEMAVGKRAATVVNRTVKQYAPGAARFVAGALKDAEKGDADASEEFSGRTVSLQAVSTADGAILTLTIET